VVWECWGGLVAGGLWLARLLANGSKARQPSAIAVRRDSPPPGSLAQSLDDASGTQSNKQLDELLSSLVEYLDRRRVAADGAAPPGRARGLGALWSALVGPTRLGAPADPPADAGEAARLHASLLAARAMLLELDAERNADLNTVLNQSGVNNDVRAYIASSYLAGLVGDGTRSARPSAGDTSASQSFTSDGGFLQHVRFSEGPSKMSPGKRGSDTGAPFVGVEYTPPRGGKSQLNTTSLRDISVSGLEKSLSKSDDSFSSTRRSTATDADDDKVINIDDVLPKKVHPDVKTAGINFSFDTLRLKHVASPLLEVVPQIVRLMELDDEMTPGAIRKFLRFVKAVAKGYQNKFYHNELHAADVTCRMTAIMFYAGIKDRPVDMLAGLIAAIIHDYGHPGTSNNFHVATQSPHARRWNNQAVLENHSLECCLSMIEQPDTDFLEGYSMQQRVKIRNKVIAIVLATDLSRHFEIQEQFRKKVGSKAAEKGKASKSVLRRTDSASALSLKANTSTRERVLATQRDRNLYASLDTAERLLVLQMAMKVADIGHCSTPLGQHLQWLQRLEDEMFLQGDMEKRLDLPVSLFADRTKPGVYDPANQEGFFLAVVEPAVKLWVSVFHSSEPLLKMTQQNLRYWVALLPRSREAQNSRVKGTESK